jgi:hypothetical protein
VLGEVIAARDEIVLSTDGEANIIPDDDDEGPLQRRLGPSADAIAKFSEHRECGMGKLPIRTYTGSLYAFY